MASGIVVVRRVDTMVRDIFICVCGTQPIRESIAMGVGSSSTHVRRVGTLVHTTGIVIIVIPRRHHLGISLLLPDIGFTTIRLYKAQSLIGVATYGVHVGRVVLTIFFCHAIHTLKGLLWGFVCFKGKCVLRGREQREFTTIFDFRNVTHFFMPDGLILNGINVSTIFFVVYAKVCGPGVGSILYTIQTFCEGVVITTTNRDFSLKDRTTQREVVSLRLRLFKSLALIVIITMCCYGQCIL